jgi:hypothetical protein
VSLPSSPDFAGIRQQALTELAAASEPTALQAWRNRYLGRQGETQKLLDGLKSLPAAERPAAGKAANDLRKALEEAWTAKGGGESAEAAATPGVDPTLPGRPYPSGAVHVLTQTLDRITDIFHRLGFALADGPEIETEHHNFDASTPSRIILHGMRRTHFIWIFRPVRMGGGCYERRLRPCRFVFWKTENHPLRSSPPAVVIGGMRWMRPTGFSFIRWKDCAWEKELACPTSKECWSFSFVN